MITFIQFLITGLRLGSVYALIALGYTMVYGIIKLINFAHGDFIMVGGYSLFFIIPVMMAAGIPGWLAVVPAVLICACVGMLVELLAYRPVRKTGNNLTCLITAIAMSFVLENLAQAIPAIGPDPKVPYTLFAKTFTVGGVSVSHATVITVAVSGAIMVALYLFTQKAKVGCAMPCVSEDKEAATLMGINVNHTILVTFAIGAGLAAVAGADVYRPVPQGLYHHGRDPWHLRLCGGGAGRHRFPARRHAGGPVDRHRPVRGQYLYQLLHVRYLRVSDPDRGADDPACRYSGKECG